MIEEIDSSYYNDKKEIFCKCYPINETTHKLYIKNDYNHNYVYIENDETPYIISRIEEGTNLEIVKDALIYCLHLIEAKI